MLFKGCSNKWGGGGVFGPEVFVPTVDDSATHLLLLTLGNSWDTETVSQGEEGLVPGMQSQSESGY